MFFFGGKSVVQEKKKVRASRKIYGFLFEVVAKGLCKGNKKYKGRMYIQNIEYLHLENMCVSAQKSRKLHNRKDW